MQLPLVTPELVLRIEAVWRSFWSAHLTGMRDRPGNPLGVAVEQYGRTLALRAAANPHDPWLNRVLGLTDADLPYLPELIGGYRNQGIAVHLEIMPGLAGEGLMEALSDLGCRQTGFHSVTYGLPVGGSDEPSPDLTVTEVGPEDQERFLRTLLQGFGAPADVPVDSMRHWCDIPGVRLFLAHAGGEPAGAAVLYVKDGIGYMANASTRPEMRGRGCQQALLHRRIAAAREQGCELVAAMAAFDSVSQHNMERVGMRMAYTKAVWKG